ncbi:amino acid--tRNA ligase-related protein [Senegalia massiliensis]|uniref:amino acid--tRNA ligase-related protein n=1 Tax=Senegalia massiliensis TaxID=1720316 RepID=UPI001032643C|nr:amino acid--tRNA ligase-related protein [Senegalia massiliensis]
MDFKSTESRLRKLDSYRTEFVSKDFSKYKAISVKEVLDKTFSQDNTDLVRINGRVLNIRKYKYSSYVILKDFDSKILLQTDESINYNFLKYIDTGDWIEVIGIENYSDEIKKIVVIDFKLIAKCRFIFPKKLVDKRKRFENRFLDFSVNDNSLEVVKISSLINKSIRKTLWDKGYSEYNTPTLFSSFNGGVSTPFTTKITALKRSGYLKVTSELYLKQLISAGFSSVFEIAGSFRNEGIDNTHIPGFPLLEVYKSFADAEYMLELNLEIIEKILIDLNGEPCIHLPNKKRIECSKNDWKKINAHEVIKNKTHIDILSDINNLRIQARKIGIECSDVSGPSTVIGNIIDKTIRIHTTEPIILTHLPSSMTPLMKKLDEDNRFSDRYWLYLNGVDISDIGSEQADYEEQIESLEKQFEMMHEAYPHISINKDLVKVVSYGLPKTGGIGCSLSRLLMAIMSLDDVRETPTFPYV